MTIWKKLFTRKHSAGPQNAAPFDWDQFPTITAIALLDADAFSRAPAILYGLLGLRDVLIEAAYTYFPDGSRDVNIQLATEKCQFLASADKNAGLTVSALGPATRTLCSDHGFDLVDCDSEGFGIPVLYSSTIAEAWGEWHVVADANLTKEHWRRIIALIPKEMDAPARMALGKSADSQYVVAVLHREIVYAHGLVPVDAGPSFNDFCTGAAKRMKSEKVGFDVVGLEADAVMDAEGSIRLTAILETMGKDSRARRGQRPWHDIKWSVSELGRPNAFPKI